ncbi:MAG: hypothetical protein KDK99_03750 [Verrucomicrobiales bacterium]|nr:hypothetical protein [Verrucomicrobiales bacterium]
MKGHPSKAIQTQRHDEVDAEVGDALVEVKIGLDSRRALSSALMKLAYLLAEKPGFRGFLVLVDSAITLPRLREEWARAAQVLRLEIQQRLHIFQYQTDTLRGVPTDPDAEMQRIIREVVSREQSSIAGLHQSRSATPYYDILRILINQWIKRAGPLTSRWLAEAAGCTYPTVASSLEKLEKYLTRHSDRRVELKAFPKDEWFRLVANAEKVRQTLRFADHSGQPRSVESLLTRLQNLRLEGVAIAGVPGARRLHPSLDLIGTPRLDLTLHDRARQPDIGFLRQLDPALIPAVRGEPARLVIHALRYPHRFSETDANGILWADPVECLLDLHEMRLEPQALEFLQALTPKPGTP